MQELKNKFQEMESIFKSLKLNESEIGKLTDKKKSCPNKSLI